MFRPVPMVKVHIFVLAKYLDAVTAVLGRCGVVHLEDATRQSESQLLDGVDPGRELREYVRLLQRAGDLLERLGLSREFVPPPASPLDAGALRSIVDSVEARYAAEQEAIEALIQESGSLVQISERLEAFPFRRVRIAELRDLHHLYMATGRLAPDRLREIAAKLHGRAVVLHEFDAEKKQERVLLLASRKQRWAVESELKQAEFEPEPLPEGFSESPEVEQNRMRRRLSEIQQAIEEHRRKIREIRDEFAQALSAAYAQLEDMAAILRARRFFGRTEQVYCITGWLPRTALPEVEAACLRAGNGTAVIEVVEPDADGPVLRGKEKVPVKFPDVRWLKPFQQLVVTYGVPRYDEVEPSLFLAVTFVLMFGMMFGDLGHGLFFTAIGFYLWKSARPGIRKLRDTGLFLVLCGGSASVFGIFYDSFFGREGIISSAPVLGGLVLVHPLEDVMALFRVAVILGVFCISIGILFNIVNHFRRRQYFEGILDKFGVIGLVFYWGSLGLGLKAAVAGRVHSPELLFLVVLPLVLLFLKEPLAHLLERDMEHGGESARSGPGLMIFTSIIEVMETLTTFLSNTISFVRLAGFALSHAALCLAVYTVADMIRGIPSGGFLAGIAVVAGNLLVMGIEGMIVTIQGLRLEYYEMFSKFFSGDGVLYAPFKLAGTAGSVPGISVPPGNKQKEKAQ